MRKSIGILVFLLSYAVSALAHDLWVERQGNSRVLQYGHWGTGELPYHPEQVLDATCFSSAGAKIHAEMGYTYPVTLRGDCTVTWFLTSSGYWSKTPYGTKNLPKGQAGVVIDSWLSMESVKRLDGWATGLAKPLTTALEIVPLADPLKLSAGDKLRLIVFLEGRPAAGVTVAYFGQPRGITDEHGRINVRLQNAGFQLIQASLQRPLNDGMADKLIQSATLQFESQ